MIYKMRHYQSLILFRYLGFCMKLFKLTVIAVLIAVSSFSNAEIVDESSDSNSSHVDKVKDILNLSDDAHVTIEGKLIKQVAKTKEGKEKGVDYDYYILADRHNPKDKVCVEIDDKKTRGLKIVLNKTIIRIQGKIDKEIKPFAHDCEKYNVDADIVKVISP